VSPAGGAPRGGKKGRRPSASSSGSSSSSATGSGGRGTGRGRSHATSNRAKANAGPERGPLTPREQRAKRAAKKAAAIAKGKSVARTKAGAGRGAQVRLGSEEPAGPGRPTDRRGRAVGPRTNKDKGLGGEQVEGRQAVRELLLANRRKVREVWVAVSDQDDPEAVDDLAELAMSVGVPVRDVSRAKLFAEARTESPQGVLAKAHGLPEAELDQLAKRPRKGPAPFLLAVDGVTDPGNLGALLRSAEGAGVTGVVLPRHRAVHVTPTVAKAAAGAIEHLPMTVVGGLPAAISKLQGLGVLVVGLDMGGDTSLFDLPVTDEPVMLVLGAEGKGLSRLVAQRCDVVASIPLGGQLASLNVAAAGVLACFEIARRRLAAGSTTAS
jgi:23S rRNA (guanosine2251-2'-O)-methyltransferase